MEQKKEIPQPLMVTIRCCTFNHEPYIRDCLEGFVMQKTNFRFEAIVHDDASTDGTAAIIKEYAVKYPDIIKPILETENQYSKHDGSLGRIMNEHTHGKYVAYCEGDDYWIDPLKLQKQVDFLESHPDYSMCWTNAYIETNGKKEPYKRYPKDQQSPMEDIIEKGGDFIPTCSIVVRTACYFAMPQEAKGYFCGDYPLQMWCAYYGKVYYIKNLTCVYRFMSIGSWSQKFSQESRQQRIEHYYKEKELLDNFNKLFIYQYNESFEKRAANVLYSILLSVKAYDLAKPYLALRRKYGLHIDKSIALRILGYPHLASLVSILSRIKGKIYKKEK